MIFNLCKLLVNKINACIMNDEPMPDSNNNMYTCKYTLPIHILADK